MDHLFEPRCPVILQWPDPLLRDKVWVKLGHWPDYKCCTAVEYRSEQEARDVFSTLRAYPLESDSIASPICYRDRFIAFEMYSNVTLDILSEAGFPVDRTYSTVRRIISAMMDMHDAGLCGLPPDVYSFVRTEVGSKRCKLFYASMRREDCSVDEWEDAVSSDYMNMEAFVIRFIRIPNNSVVLMKSVDLFDHFVGVLRTHRNKSFQEKQRDRPFVLGHPLLKSYPKVAEFLNFVGWSYIQPNPDQVDVAAAVNSIPNQNWDTVVWGLPFDSRYRKCLSAGKDQYAGHAFVEYCRHLMGHSRDYDLYEHGFAWDGMIRQFEVFYPSYLGILWIALGEHARNSLAWRG